MERLPDTPPPHSPQRCASFSSRAPLSPIRFKDQPPIPISSRPPTLPNSLSASKTATSTMVIWPSPSYMIHSTPFRMWRGRGWKRGAQTSNNSATRGHPFFFFFSFFGKKKKKKKKLTSPRWPLAGSLISLSVISTPSCSSPPHPPLPIAYVDWTNQPFRSFFFFLFSHLPSHPLPFPAG